MKRKEIASVIESIGIVPAIRVSSADDAHFAAEAVAGGGIPIVEITMTLPRALDVIAPLLKQHPKLVGGAGTGLDFENAPPCPGAGAPFFNRPGFDWDLWTF